MKNNIHTPIIHASHSFHSSLMCEQSTTIPAAQIAVHPPELSDPAVSRSSAPWPLSLLSDCTLVTCTCTPGRTGHLCTGLATWHGRAGWELRAVMKASCELLLREEVRAENARRISSDVDSKQHGIRETSEEIKRPKSNTQAENCALIHNLNNDRQLQVNVYDSTNSDILAKHAVQCFFCN